MHPALLGLVLVLANEEEASYSYQDNDYDNFHSEGCIGPHTPNEVLVQVEASHGANSKTSPAAAQAAAAGIYPPAASTQVHAKIGFVSLEAVDTKKQHVKMQVWWYTQWRDARLAWSNATHPACLRGTHFEGSPKGTFWTPSLYSEAWVESPKIISSGFWMQTVAGDAEIQVVTKEIWTVSCKMDFTEMPYDKQYCTLPITTWVEPVSEVNLTVYPGDVGIEMMSENPTVGHLFDDAGGEVEWKFNRSDEKTASFLFYHGYPGLMFKYTLERESHYYASNVIHSIHFLVGLAYLSFYIARAAVPARVGLIAVTYLAISNTISSVRATLPKISGSIWLLDFLNMSVMFIFTSGVEYAIANYLTRAEARVTKALAKYEAIKAAATAVVTPAPPSPRRRRPSLEASGTDEPSETARAKKKTKRKKKGDSPVMTSGGSEAEASEAEAWAVDEPDEAPQEQETARKKLRRAAKAAAAAAAERRSATDVQVSVTDDDGHRRRRSPTTTPVTDDDDAKKEDSRRSYALRNLGATEARLVLNFKTDVSVRNALRGEVGKVDWLLLSLSGKL